jgi:hypothetical protein
MADSRTRAATGKDQSAPSEQYILQECGQLRDEIWTRVRDQRATERYMLLACAVIYWFLSLERKEPLSEQVQILVACAWYVPPVLAFLAVARWCENVRLIERIAEYTRWREKQTLGPPGGWEIFLDKLNNGRKFSVLLSGYYVLFWLFLIFSTMTVAAYQHAPLVTAWRLSAALLTGWLAAVAVFAVIARIGITWMLRGPWSARQEQVLGS